MAWTIRGSAGVPYGMPAELVQRWVVDETLGNELVRRPDVAGVEDLELRLDPELLDASRAGPQHLHGAHVDHVVIAEVQRPAVQRAQLRA